MRIGQVVLSFAGVALALVSSQALQAQTAVAAPNGIVGGVFSVARQEPAVRTREPYTATRKTTRVQKLANGTTITHVTIVKEARDSSGRTYRENRSEVPSGAEDATGFVFVNVNDPVSRVNISWNSRSKEAMVNHFPERRDIQRVEAPQAAVTLPDPPAARTEMPRPEVEDLGVKTINGVEAKGTRTTRVIPAGREGNDQPLTVIHETWFSTALGMPVMTINDDPRTGTSTMELTEIEHGEPDAALFQVPEGYTVKERTPGQVE